MRYQLIPYVFNGMSWNLSDEMIKGVFYKMAGHDLIKTVFLDGKIKTPEQFLQLAKSPGNVVHIILDAGGQLVFWAYLNSFGWNHAFGHFCGFPDIWGKAQELGKMTLDYWFGMPGRQSDRPLFDLICGRVPADNSLAIGFVKKLGFTVLPVIPKMIWDEYQQAAVGAVFCYKEREA